MLKFVKKFFKARVYTCVIILILAIFIVKPINQTPLAHTQHYRDWVQYEQNLSFAHIAQNSMQDTLLVGWAKESIVPQYTTPMGGYGKRWGKNFENIDDTIAVRAISLTNQHNTMYFVSADMMIIPPNVVSKLTEKLKDKNISTNHIYFGATHTHHSLGGWADKMGGYVFSGKFDEKVVDYLAEKFFNAIVHSTQNIKKSKLFYTQDINDKNIAFRLKSSNGSVNPRLHSLHFVRDDGSKAQLVIYSAHATVLLSKYLHISGDYPYTLVNILENNGNDFALFMAGAVGSMSYNLPEEIHNHIEEKNTIAQQIAQSITNQNLNPIKGFYNHTLQIPQPEAQMKINNHLCLRTWVFHQLMGQLSSRLQVTLLGNVLMIGVPADFSGELANELYHYAQKKNINLIITSFNGGYNGYILPDNRFFASDEEANTMNWSGYQAGSYYKIIIQTIINKISTR